MGRKSNLYMSDTQGWLRILRISNSPTIVSNIMVGVALSIHAHHVQWSDRIHSPPLQLFKPLFFISTVLLLLYFAGMILNDAFDAKRDADIRPERPIPQGVISVRNAWVVGFIMLATAFLISLGIGIASGLATFALIFCILLYTVFHHSSVAAIPLMALCRGLVLVVAYSAFS